MKMLIEVISKYKLSVFYFLKSHNAVNRIVSTGLILFTIIELDPLLPSPYVKVLWPICL